MSRNLTQDVAVGGPGPEVTVELKHMIFFILLIILPRSDPLATSTALLPIIHTARLYIPIKMITLCCYVVLFCFAPACMFLYVVFFLAALSASFL